jgi:Cd2+/Zn2+-exporting ATPase
VTADARPACTVCDVHAESTFRVEGLDCHEEVALLERRLKHLAGLERMSADVVGGRLRVQYDAAKLSTAAITEAVADTGMRAWLEHERSRLDTGGPWRTVLLSTSGASLVVGLLSSAFDGPPLLPGVSYLTAVVAGGGLTARRAWASVRLGALDMHVLMSIAVVGALAIGEWSEAASVVFLFALAQFLETRSLDRARHAIRALMDLSPVEARRLSDGREQVVPVASVAVGDRLRIRPGDKIPLDGVVLGGASDVNQAPITGESLPVDKAPGDQVYAGTINGHGTLELEVTRVARDTTLARIIHLVEEAQAKRAPSQAFVDRFARWYTPAVIAAAVLVATVPIAAGWGATGDWLYRALVLLVIACPCALVISTPVSIVSALAAAARNGVLIKGGVHLERLAAVRAVAFDKTGTLTEGSPEVVEVAGFEGHSAEEVLAMVAGLDQHSSHPVARAIVRAARDRGLTPVVPDVFTSHPGLGVEGELLGVRLLAGTPRLVRERGLFSEPVAAAVEQHTAIGRTSVLLALGSDVVGLIALADRPRKAAADVLELLRQQRIGPLVMLTGDGAGAAGAVAAAVGVDETRAGLLPQDKVAALQGLKRAHGSVAMVGDGVNDAPALAAADVGVVMGAAGSDVALETADVALMSDELARLPYAVRLSRATVTNIRTNIAVSLLVKAMFLGLAVTGHATLWMAILADTGTSLLVVANGLRLLRTR